MKDYAYGKRNALENQDPAVPDNKLRKMMYNLYDEWIAIERRGVGRYWIQIMTPVDHKIAGDPIVSRTVSTA